MSRLSQMLSAELKRRGKSERELAREFGWSQQAFNTWKSGGVPRQQFFVRLGDFLNISQTDLQMLIDEAKEGAGSTKLPNMGAPMMGRGSPQHITIDQFPFGYAKPQIEGTYAVRVDGRIYWANPNLTPVAGNLVLVREGNHGKLETWPCGGESVHVIVLAEMI